MDVHELRHQAEINSKKTLKIYNPDTEPFSVKFDNKKWTIQAMEIEEFPYFVANHIKKHLADHLLFKRGIKNSPQEDLSNIFEEIEVSI